MTGVLLRVLIVLLAVATGACAARGGVPRPFPGAAIPPGATEPPVAGAEPSAETAGLPAPAAPRPFGTGMVEAVVRTALDFLGVPYRNGGSSPAGFDCSGFVQYIFSQHGRPLPREVRDQFRLGREVQLKEVRPGDLLFFQTVSRGASHVGVAIGEGRFVHAPSSRGVVRVEPYSGSYWARRFVGARRLADDVTAARPAVFPGSIRSAR